jgi:hypothetical protein
MDGGDRPGHTGTTTDSDLAGEDHLDVDSPHRFDADAG